MPLPSFSVVSLEKITSVLVVIMWMVVPAALIRMELFMRQFVQIVKSWIQPPYFLPHPVHGETIMHPAIGARCNLALVKIALTWLGVKAGIESLINGVPRDSAGCVPLTVDFADTVHNAKSYEWNFGDGSPTVITTDPNTSHVFNSIGTYLVRLVAVDSTTCNIRDTAYVHIRVGDIQATINFNPVKLNPCDSFKYRFDNLSTAPVPLNNTSFTWDFGDGSPRITAGTASVFHNYAAPELIT